MVFYHISLYHMVLGDILVVISARCLLSRIRIIPENPVFVAWFNPAHQGLIMQSTHPPASVIYYRNVCKGIERICFHFAIQLIGLYSISAELAN